jgi:hypothetical protein
MSRKSIIPEEKITYFDKPTMVKFKETWEDGEEYIIGGIAYCGEIICGECGSIIEIDDGDLEIVEILSWVDISDFILN